MLQQNYWIFMQNAPRSPVLRAKKQMVNIPLFPPVFLLKKHLIKNKQLSKSLQICIQKKQWIASYAATSVLEKQKSQCALLLLQYKMENKLLYWCQPRCSHNNTIKIFKIVFQIGRYKSMSSHVLNLPKNNNKCSKN